MLQWILKKVKVRRVSAAQAEARRLIKYADQLLSSTDKLTDPQAKMTALNCARTFLARARVLNGQPPRT